MYKIILFKYLYILSFQIFIDFNNYRTYNTRTTSRHDLFIASSYFEYDVIIFSKLIMDGNETLLQKFLSIFATLSAMI